jgi:hypothetical protein
VCGDNNAKISLINLIHDIGLNWNVSCQNGQASSKGKREKLIANLTRNFPLLLVTTYEIVAEFRGEIPFIGYY